MAVSSIIMLRPANLTDGTQFPQSGLYAHVIEIGLPISQEDITPQFSDIGYKFIRVKRSYLRTNALLYTQPV